MSRILHFVFSPVLVLVAGTGIALFASADGPEFRFAERGGASGILLSGIDAETVAALQADAAREGAAWQPFAVRAVESQKREVDTTQPNVLGRYSLGDSVVFFAPQYPLSHRVSYHAEFDRGGVATFLHLEAPAVPQAKVSHVFPSADKLPANLLKFYIEFSHPMSRGTGYEFIKLFRADGSEVEDPFPAIGVELWDAQQQRYTLLFDPGRIKRGIQINEEMGLALVPGKSYTLRISAAWPDASGRPLAQDYVKSFRVVEPDHESPHTEAWEISAPASGGTAPLRVVSPESLDAALLERLLWVKDADGNEVHGKVALSGEEQTWQFVPERAWTAGRYKVYADARLEDLAGNRLERPFELDLEQAPKLKQVETVELPFVVQ